MNTGGPAFPAPHAGIADFGDSAAYPGMTLRDYFAAKALEGLLAGGWIKHGKTPETYEFAEQTYKYADAMLKAREQ